MPNRFPVIASSNLWAAAASAKSGSAKRPAVCSRRSNSSMAISIPWTPTASAPSRSGKRCSASKSFATRLSARSNASNTSKANSSSSMEMLRRPHPSASISSWNASRSAIPVSRPTKLMLRHARCRRSRLKNIDYMYEEHKLQHLDVKPRNLFLIGDRVKVADFGLVKGLDKSTNSGILGGVTPLYAPPETFRGSISPQSDQYSLAIVYQELLTGLRPYLAKNIRQMACQICTWKPNRTCGRCRSWSVRWWPRRWRKIPRSVIPIAWRFLLPCIKPARPSASLTCVPGQPEAARTGERLPTRWRTCSCPSSSRCPQMPSRERQPALLAVADDDDDGKVDMEVSQLGVTVAQPESGALRPTLIIGLGTFGRKAVMELRCRFLDRFGDLGKLPVLRFLYIDVDPEAKQVACSGSPQVALHRNDYYPMPLQPVANYRRRIRLSWRNGCTARQALTACTAFLGKRKGRVPWAVACVCGQPATLAGALCGGRFQEITHPDTIYKSVENTGAGGSSICHTPRVYANRCGRRRRERHVARSRLRHSPAAFELAPSRCQGHCHADVRRRARSGHAQARTGQRLRHADGAESLQQSGNHVQGGVRQRRPSASSIRGRRSTRFISCRSRTAAPTRWMRPSRIWAAIFSMNLTTPLGLRPGQPAVGRPISLNPVRPTGSLAVSLRCFGTYAVWFPRRLDVESRFPSCLQTAHRSLDRHRHDGQHGRAANRHPGRHGSIPPITPILPAGRLGQSRSTIMPRPPCPAKSRRRPAKC